MISIMFKKSITKILENYVRKYFAKHPDIKLIVVAGSVGKTSTKIATATILNERYRVRLHTGNHNTHLSAPLAILGIDFPDNIRSLWQWCKVFSAARKRIKASSETEPQVIIQELGTDHPGEIEQFGKSLLPDIAVITSITPEHMEFFGSIDAVAREELAAANFSKQALINHDDVSPAFANYVTNGNISTYGSNASAEYNFETEGFDIKVGFRGVMNTREYGKIPMDLHVYGQHSLRPIAAACAVAAKLGLNSEEIAHGAAKIRPVPGRMNVLRGANDSMLIDDTYNSSPAALSAALQTLYDISASSKIAVLGSMNELGSVSAAEHKKIGEMCDPVALSWVITVGDEANNYIAPAAKARGCQVKTCRNALEAGAWARKFAEPGSVILFKGSQGNIYLEEAVKVVLHSISDEDRLVRQDARWIKTKQDYFADFSTFAEEDV